MENTTRREVIKALELMATGSAFSSLDLRYALAESSGPHSVIKVVNAIKQTGWKGWAENEEEREDLSKTGLEVIAPAYKAMKEAFAG